MMLCSIDLVNRFLHRGVGCIFGEMLSGRALFQGQKGPVDQLNKIWQLLGTPNKHTWPEVVNYSEYSKGLNMFVDVHIDVHIDVCRC